MAADTMELMAKTLDGNLYNKEVAVQYYKDVLQKRSRKGKFFLLDDY